MQIDLDGATGLFRARSASVDGGTEARALVEARLPAPDVAVTPDPLVGGLLERGEAAGKGRGGRLHVDVAQRVVDAVGEPHPRVFAAGYWTSGAQVAAFARPGTNAPFFRQNDALARALWQVLAPEVAAVEVAS